MNYPYIITIKSEKRLGLLNQITGLLSRRQLDIQSITAAKSDISTIMLISIELSISERALSPLLLKLESIIEVFSAEAQLMSKAINHQLALFKLSKTFLETPQAAIIHKYAAQIVNMAPEYILLAKSGPAELIQELLQQLDGPYLIGCSRSGMIADTALMDNDDWRVMRIAA